MNKNKKSPYKMKGFSGFHNSPAKYGGDSATMIDASISDLSTMQNVQMTGVDTKPGVDKAAVDANLQQERANIEQEKEEMRRMQMDVEMQRDREVDEGRNIA